MGVLRDDGIVGKSFSVLPVIMENDAKYIEGNYWPFYERLEVDGIDVYDKDNYPSEYVAVYIGEEYREVSFGHFEGNITPVRDFEFPFLIFAQRDFFVLFVPYFRSLLLAEFESLYRTVCGSDWRYAEPSLGGFFHIDDLHSVPNWNQLVVVALDLYELSFGLSISERKRDISKVLSVMAYGSIEKRDSVNKWLEIVLR